MKNLDSGPITPRCIALGGFLGAGKSAAILRLGQLLRDQGHKIGVITNDEGTALVDTALFQAAGFPVEEILGGAFPTQFDAFHAAAVRLVADQSCDFIFAECSGTSAELRSALLTRLREKSPALLLAPLSVVVDSVRAARILRLASGGNFSENLSYLYRKQIEEADLVILNKSDLLSPAQLSNLHRSVAELAPQATLLAVSTRTGSGLDEWLNCLTSREHAPGPIPSLDSQLYHQAQSLLGWLNCTVTVSSVKYFDANKLLINLATAIQALLKGDGLEIAHFKILLNAENDSTGASEYATVNVVRNDLAPELSGEIHEPVKRADLILNLRAETKPDLLHTAVNRAVLEIMERAPELFARMEHCEHFHPRAR
jgi:G3E family GTPase